MNKRTLYISKTLAYFCGVTGAITGAALMIAPAAFEASSGIQLGTDPNLLSEVRSPGGGFLLAGLATTLLATKTRFLPIALLLIVIFFLGIGLSRLLGVFVDGLLHPFLMGVLCMEIGLGGMALFLLIKTQPHWSRTSTN